METRQNPRIGNITKRTTRILIILILLFSLINHPQTALADSKASFVVDSMLDTAPVNDANPGDGICATSSGNCTLRAAIQEANAHSGADTVFFAPGVLAVTIQTELPALTDSTGGTTISGGSDYVYILGNLTASGTDGFTINSNNNKIQGLDIVHFSGNGIVINGDSNIIGTDGNGINDAAEHNVIRENSLNGILVNSTADSNSIAGNNIGVDRTGAAKANILNGIQLSGTNNRVGVLGDLISDDLEQNLIAMNGQDGIYITNNNNVISGNTINANQDNGINVFGASLNRIGTNGDGIADANEGNLISGNREYGVKIYQSLQTSIAGNRIGTNAAGDARNANMDGGIYLWDSQINLIGTDGAGAGAGAEGNLISGHYLLPGIKIYLGDSNTIAGNKIGTNFGGTSALENGSGIMIDGSSYNQVGTNGDGIGDALEGNLISGNSNNGLTVVGLNSTGNVIAGNRIGVNVDGTAALPNGNNGIILAPNGDANLVGTNADGTSDMLERNQISGNVNCGVYINGFQNHIAGNFIGLNANGTAAIANQKFGICIYNAQANAIGANGDGIGDALEGNLISGNGEGGIYLGTTGAETKANTIYGNRIGTTVSGSPLPNSGMGIWLENVGDNRIGYSTPGLGNIIAYHLAPGIVFTSPTSVIGNQIIGNSMYSNYFGIDLSANGVTHNDSGDGDTGPNGLLNFPVLLGAESTGDSISIALSYSSKPSKHYGLDFYWSRTCNSTGYGEGEVYLGWDSITTDASGSAVKQIGLAVSNARPGFITATANDSDGSTSEFSQCIALEGVVEYRVFLPALLR